VDIMPDVPGLGWVYSKPLPPATEGREAYYFTISSPGLVSRIVMADVARSRSSLQLFP
jgi:hypothetical protein